AMCTTGLATLSVVGSVNPVYAAAEAEADTDTGPVIEEVLVTAQKRPESEQQVPIAIQVIGETQLTALGIRNTNDLPQLVPGFMISSSASVQLYYLRGVGSQQVGTSASSEVSTFVDGVYMPFQTANLQG